MKSALIALSVLVAFAAKAQQQISPAAVSVGLCQLTDDPDKYAGKRVQVHGRISQGLESFTVTDGQCTGAGKAVWLTYGDQQQSVDYQQRYTAQKIPRTGFIRNRESEQLKGLLQAYRPFTPSGDECDSGRCSYFNVFATVTGWFVTGKHSGKRRGGLGHMGCCYLIVMERVSDVTGKRTEVPFGGLYTCRTDEWHPSNAELAALSTPMVQQRASYEDWLAWRVKLFANVAQHWQDAKVQDGHIDFAAWTSSDLSRQYQIRTGLDNYPTTIVRVACSPQPAYQPKQATSEILCSQKYWSEPQHKGKPPVQLFSAPEPESAARSILSIAEKSWGPPELPLLTNTCKHVASENYDTGGCSFTTQDGKTSAWVELGRTQKQKKKNAQYDWDNRAWSAFHVHASVCSE